MKQILNEIEKYYSDKIKEYGATSRGVDWNSKESQFLRFEQLCKVISSNHFSILDYGCGYGSLIEYLKSRFKEFEYLGYDVSEEMIVKAKSIFPNYKFTTILDNNLKFDYVIASGIFNVKLETTDNEWLKYILQIVHQMNQLSTKGFSFNILTKYSDKEYMKDYLYYADPCYFFDYCKRNFSRNVSLLHDYNLYEFTILIKK